MQRYSHSAFQHNFSAKKSPLLNIIFNLTKISLHILTLHNKYHTTITNFLRISLTGDIMPPRKLIIKHLLRADPSHSHKSVRFFLDYCH